MPQYLKDVVYYNAPFIIGETRNGANNPEAVDQLLPVDFDGDSLGANNQTNAEIGAVVPSRAASTVYYSIVETGVGSSAGYYFIGYYFYHPKDGGETIDVGAGTHTTNGHQHDMEGVYLVVRKTPVNPFGVLVLSFTEAHGALVPFKSPGRFSPDPPPEPCCSGATHGWGGWNYTWFDNVAGISRPVVAVRSRTHGTYMAQDCQLIWTTPYGIDVTAYNANGTMRVCPHDDSQYILYRPEYYNQGLAQRLGPTVRSGTWYYRLASIQEAPFWSLRASLNVMFGGQLRTIGTRGERGFDKFATQTIQEEAGNPPWAWYGAAECHVGSSWYMFAVDNTSYYNSCTSWAIIDPGTLLTDPISAVLKKFPWFTEVQQYTYQYIPYMNPPGAPYCTDCAGAYHAMSLSITGPDQVVSGKSARWTATVSGGTGPYMYEWSGALSGTGASIQGALYSSDVLYLDVYDETGAQISVSKPITVDASCGAGKVC